LKIIVDEGESLLASGSLLGDCNLYKEEAEAMETAGAIRQLTVGARGDQSFGVWDEKRKRAANSKPDTLTVTSCYLLVCCPTVPYPPPACNPGFFFASHFRLPLSSAPTDLSGPNLKTSNWINLALPVLKGMSHEIDLKNFDQTLKNLT
jgi:hypothetical protein